MLALAAAAVWAAAALAAEADLSSGGDPDATVIRDESGRVVSSRHPELGTGTWLWLALFSAAGAGAGLGHRWLGRRPLRAARLDAPPSPPVPPRRLRAGEAAPVLDRLAPAFRVVVVGGPPVPGTVRCLDDAVLPAEIVAAVERIAATAGLPVALLVAEPGRLESALGDPVAALDRAVGRRFPLFVVDGPDEWEPAGGGG